MTAKDQELTRLLGLYRKGHISEEVLLAQMAEVAEASGGATTAGEAPVRDERSATLLLTLDAYRAAEASGARTIAAWAELTDDAALAGGLRTVAAREAAHAALLERRIRELGGIPRAEVPEWLGSYNAAIASPLASDEERLAAVVGQFPDIDAALVPLQQTIESINDDDLTRELLRTICADELATLEWAHEMYAERATGDG